MRFTVNNLIFFVMDSTPEIDFRQLSDWMPQMVFVANPRGEAIYYNRRWLEYIGRSGFVSGGWADVIHPDDLRSFSEAWSRAQVARKSWEGQFRVRRRDASYRWHLGRSVPILNQDGAVLNWIGTVTDIEEHKASEDELRRAKDSLEVLATDKSIELQQMNSFLDSLIENIPNMIFVKDAENLRFVRFNRAGEELLGLSRHELLGKSDFDLFDAQEAARFQELDRKVIAEGRIHDIPEEPVTSKTLGLRLLHTKKIPLRDSEGIPRYLLGISEDITEQKIAAEASIQRLREQIAAKESERAQERLLFLSKASAVLGSSLDFHTTLTNLTNLCVPQVADWCSIETLNPDGTLSQISVAHSNPSKLAMGRKFQETYPSDPKGASGPYRVVREGLAEFIPHLTSEMLEAGARSPKHLAALKEFEFQSYICVPIRARNRTLGALTLVTTRESGRVFSTADLNLAGDLAERAGYAVENAQLYNESANLNRIKDEFLATLSHELRTPMNVIRGHAEILKNHGPELSTDQVATSVEAIYRNASAQTELISDLLDVSSIITGKVSYQPAPFSPAESLKNILDGMITTAEAKGVKLISDLSRAPMQVVADATRLHQVIWNLLSNALKFTPRGGSVRLMVEVAKEEWSITVTDTGRGIDAGFLPYVFDRFRQEDATSTRTFGGLGLGLSIVRHLVEIHGGRVSVESEGRGKGSTFRIYLPLVSLPTTQQTSTRHAETPAPTEQPGSNLLGVKVLVIEDSVDNRELIRFYLSRAGATVYEADSAEGARKKLNELVPDIIVSDIGLPDENGIEMIRKLRAHPRPEIASIPAVAFTAYVRETEQVAAIEAGFQKHLGKPVSGTVLVNTLRELLPKKS